MNSYKLKYLAIFFMIIDHTGTIFFPTNIWFRIFGRLSFPIFSFLLVQGYFFTKNKNKYGLRLLIFSLISQIPFSLLFNTKHLNIFFTLFFSFLFIWFNDNYNIKKILLSSIFIFILSYFVNFDYSIYGIFHTYFIFKFKNNIFFMFLSLLFLNIFSLSISTLQIYSIFSFLIIIFYKEENIIKKFETKLIFYLFYPVHLLLLFILNNF